MTISFKGAHFPKDIILYAVFFYLRYNVSYRDLEEIMAARGHGRSCDAQQIGGTLCRLGCGRCAQAKTAG